jgi:hypothetical protein
MKDFARQILDEVCEKTSPDCDTQAIIAAAFRAAAKLPYDVPPHVIGESYWPYRNGMNRQRDYYLSIADELSPET